MSKISDYVNGLGLSVYVGRKVHITLHQPLLSEHVVDGELVCVRDHGVLVVDQESGSLLYLPYSSIHWMEGDLIDDQLISEAGRQRKPLNLVDNRVACPNCGEKQTSLATLTVGSKRQEVEWECDLCHIRFVTPANYAPTEPEGDAQEGGAA